MASKATILQERQYKEAINSSCGRDIPNAINTLYYMRYFVIFDLTPVFPESSQWYLITLG